MTSLMSLPVSAGDVGSRNCIPEFTIWQGILSKQSLLFNAVPLSYSLLEHKIQLIIKIYTQKNDKAIHFAFLANCPNYFKLFSNR